MLRISKARRDFLNEVIHEFTERRRRRKCCWRLRHCTADLDGVPPIGEDPSRLIGFQTCVCEGYACHAAQPHLLELAVPTEQEGPPLGAGLLDYEVEAIAVRVPPRHGDRGYFPSGHPVRLPSHSYTSHPNFHPNTYLGFG